MVCAAGTLAVGCAPATQPYRSHLDHILTVTHRSKEVAAPTDLHQHHWRLGQWSLYKLRSGNNIGAEFNFVVAEDACGTWVQHVSESYHSLDEWTFCVRPVAELPNDPEAAFDFVQVAMERIDNGTPTVIDLRHLDAHRRSEIAWIFWSLVPQTIPEIAPPIPQEDVDVPAGHFVQAFHPPTVWLGKEPVRLETWLHPGAQFDGLVKQDALDGSFEKVLLAVGDCGAPSLPMQMLQQNAIVSERSRMPPIAFISAGAGGFGHLTGHGDERPSGAYPWELSSGTRLTTHLDLLLGLSVAGGATYSPDPAVSQDSLLYTGGVRWSPFRERLRDAPQTISNFRALYVQASLGYALLHRDSSTSTHTAARGLGIGAAVGWLPLQAWDWAIGVEVNDLTALYDAGEGVRQGFGFLAVLQLYYPGSQPR